MKPPKGRRLALIPARGGSKRIPHKNVKDFCGKPMIGYSIEAAQRSGLFSDILVSTDDPKIAKLAESFGALVPFMRPAEFSDDYTPLASVILHGLKAMQELTGQEYETLCCILATAPFIQTQDLKASFELMNDPEVTGVLPVTSFPFPIFRALKANSQGGFEMVWPEHELTRSNDLPETFHDVGQFYWLRSRSFLEEKKVYARAAKAFHIPRWRVQDIDTPEDWERAEMIFTAMRNQLGN